MNDAVHAFDSVIHKGYVPDVSSDDIYPGQQVRDQGKVGMVPYQTGDLIPFSTGQFSGYVAAHKTIGSGNQYFTGRGGHLGLM